MVAWPTEVTGCQQNERGTCGSHGPRWVRERAWRWVSTTALTPTSWNPGSAPKHVGKEQSLAQMVPETQVLLLCQPVWGWLGLGHLSQQWGTGNPVRPEDPQVVRRSMQLCGVASRGRQRHPSEVAGERRGDPGCHQEMYQGSPVPKRRSSPAPEVRG